jgi:hypothetical protein
MTSKFGQFLLTAVATVGKAFSQAFQKVTKQSKQNKYKQTRTNKIDK